MRKWLSVFVLFTALPAPQAVAQVLWNGAAYGMSPAQVQARLPQSQVPDSPDELAGGESEGLRMDDVELAGHRFQASFFFAGDALAQVTLSQLAAREGAVDRQVFEDVAHALEAAHGAPLATDWRHEPFERRSQEWQVDGARIQLVLIQAGTGSFVNVVHQVRPPDAPPPVRLQP